MYSNKQNKIMPTEALTSDNFSKFLSRYNLQYQPQHRIANWNIIEKHFGISVLPEHISMSSKHELLEIGIDAWMAESLIQWSQSVPKPKCSSTSVCTPTSSKNMSSKRRMMEEPLEINQSKVRKVIQGSPNQQGSQKRAPATLYWVHPKKGTIPGVNWTNYDRRSDRNQTKQQWREEFQVERSVGPMIHLLKDANVSFPLVKVDTKGRRDIMIRIVINGQDNSILEGNDAVLDEEGRAEFPNFMVKKRSYDDAEGKYKSWNFSVELYQLHTRDSEWKSLISVCKQRSMLMVFGRSIQPRESNFKIYSISPSVGIMGVRQDININVSRDLSLGSCDKMLAVIDDIIYIATRVSDTIIRIKDVTYFGTGNVYLYLMNGSVESQIVLYRFVEPETTKL